MTRRLSPLLLLLGLLSLTDPAARAEAPPEPSDIPAALRVLADLVPRLHAGDGRAARDAAVRLRRLGALAEPAVKPLEQLADTGSDADAREYAAEAATHIRAELWFWSFPADPADPAQRLPRIVEALAAQLADKDAAARIRVVRQLSAMGAAAGSAVPKLQQLARSDPDDTARRAATLALRKISTAEAQTQAWARSQNPPADRR